MTSKQVEFIVKLRDSALMIAEAADEFLKAMAPPELGLETQQSAGVIEITFSILKWEAQKGFQLGDFDAAYKANIYPRQMATCLQHTAGFKRNHQRSLSWQRLRLFLLDLWAR
jgi:hypothetical protein